MGLVSSHLGVWCVVCEGVSLLLFFFLPFFSFIFILFYLIFIFSLPFYLTIRG